MTTCAAYPLGTFDDLKYVVTLSFDGARLLLSRHRARETWETQGGHIEPGETPEQAARRELYEESGATEYTLTPLCEYRARDEQSADSGAVFMAEIAALGPLPESEMAEACWFDGLPAPDALTYPQITPALYQLAIRARNA